MASSTPQQQHKQREIKCSVMPLTDQYSVPEHTLVPGLNTTVSVHSTSVSVASIKVLYDPDTNSFLVQKETLNMFWL